MSILKKKPIKKFVTDVVSLMVTAEVSSCIDLYNPNDHDWALGNVPRP